jgi:hypothetical protein
MVLVTSDDLKDTQIGVYTPTYMLKGVLKASPTSQP